MTEPVEPCPTCPEGWRPLDKEHCATCYEGQIERLRHALEVLLAEATSFSVSGVYFDEDCMGHKGPALARAALTSGNSEGK